VRNFYGSQLNSFEADVLVRPLSAELHVQFIRAPKLEALSPEVEVHAMHGDDQIFLQHGRIMATSFHIELGDDTRLHRYFLEL